MYLFITLQHTEIRFLKVRLSGDDVVEDDHVLGDEGSNGYERDKEHRAHVDNLSFENNIIIK